MKFSALLTVDLVLYPAGSMSNTKLRVCVCACHDIGAYIHSDVAAFPPPPIPSVPVRERVLEYHVPADLLAPHDLQHASGQELLVDEVEAAEFLEQFLLVELQRPLLPGVEPHAVGQEALELPLDVLAQRELLRLGHRGELLDGGEESAIFLLAEPAVLVEREEGAPLRRRDRRRLARRLALRPDVGQAAVEEAVVVTLEASLCVQVLLPLDPEVLVDDVLGRLGELVADQEQVDEGVAQSEAAQLLRQVDEGVGEARHAEPAFDHALDWRAGSVRRSRGRSGVHADRLTVFNHVPARVGKQPLQYVAVRVEDLVDMVPAEAVGGLAKGVAEEAADAAVPGLDPREHALALGQLGLELVDVGRHELLVDAPLPGLGVQAQEADADGARGQRLGDRVVSLGSAGQVDGAGLALVELEAEHPGE